MSIDVKHFLPISSWEVDPVGVKLAEDLEQWDREWMAHVPPLKSIKERIEQIDRDIEFENSEIEKIVSELRKAEAMLREGQQLIQLRQENKIHWGNGEHEWKCDQLKNGIGQVGVVVAEKDKRRACLDVEREELEWFREMLPLSKGNRRVQQLAREFRQIETEQNQIKRNMILFELLCNKNLDSEPSFKLKTEELQKYEREKIENLEGLLKNKKKEIKGLCGYVYWNGKPAYVVDQTTKDRYFNELPLVVRVKGLLLFLFGSIGMGIFLLQALVERLMAACSGYQPAKQIFYVLLSFVIFGLLILSAIYTIVSPYNGRKVFGTLERCFQQCLHDENPFDKEPRFIAPCFQPQTFGDGKGSVTSQAHFFGGSAGQQNAW